MASAAILENYLFVGDRIETRLAGLVTGVAIHSIEQLSQASEANVRDKDLFVLWERDLFPQGEGARAGAGSSQRVDQVWTVLLAVRHVGQTTKDARNQVAGPLLSAIHKALSGWTPEGAMRPLQRTNGRQASYGGNVGLYPLTFSINLNI
jgi:hypothetical protein